MWKPIKLYCSFSLKALIVQEITPNPQDLGLLASLVADSWTAARRHTIKHCCDAQLKMLLYKII